MSERGVLVCYIEDVCGDKFCYQIATNQPGVEEKYRAHARWYLRYSRRPGSHNDKDFAGRRINYPVGKCRIVVRAE